MKRALIFLGLCADLTATACGSNKPATQPPTSSAPTSGAVSIIEKDFSLAVNPATSAAGLVTFTITNQGPSVHEFVVFKSDLDPGALPLKADGSAVNEDGAGVSHIDEKEDIANGGTASLAIALQPGKYVLICNLPGHYKLGMRAGLTVSS
jgi:uncharacterized cupredoxin-like copper-binding protein